MLLLLLIIITITITIIIVIINMIIDARVQGRVGREEPGVRQRHLRGRRALCVYVYHYAIIMISSSSSSIINRR